MKPLKLVSLACFLSSIAPAHAMTIILSDDFSGGTGDINGAAPDIGASNWIASSLFNANGSVDNNLGTNGGSMTLAFTPAQGLIYTLDATISGITGNTNWFALGFANGQSSATASTSRFITGTGSAGVVGTAWMLFRGAQSPGPTPAQTFNAAQRGNGALTNTNGGLADGENWGALASDAAGTIDLRIVLDTSGGAGTWTATWFAKRDTDPTYSEVRANELVGNEANFTSVGIAVSRADASGVDGTIESFSLSYVIPEPSGVLLSSLAALGLFRRRR
jgi:hypothetical protein